MAEALSISQAIAHARQLLGELYGDRLNEVLLFGSQARGDALPDSDIDMLVVLDAPVNFYEEAKRLVRVERDLYERYRLDFSFRPCDTAAFQDEDRWFMQNVHAEGVAL